MEFNAIIPTRNSAVLFDDFVHPVNKVLRNQGIDFIYVDNQSVDGSDKLISSIVDSNSFTQNEIDRGFAASINEGVRHVKEEFNNDGHYLIISTDVLLSESFLTTLRSATLPDDFGILSFSEFNTRDLYSAQSSQSDAGTFELVEESYPSSASLFIISNRCFETLNGYREDYYLYGEDNDFFYRVKKHGFKFYKCDLPFYHKGEGYSKVKSRSSLKIIKLCYRNYLLFSRLNLGVIQQFVHMAKLLAIALFGDILRLKVDYTNRSMMRLTQPGVLMRLKFWYSAIVDVYF